MGGYRKLIAKLGQRPTLLIWVGSLCVALVLTYEIPGCPIKKSTNDTQQRILVATKDLKSGDPVVFGDVDAKMVTLTPLRGGDGFLTDQDLSFLENKILSKDVAKGQPVQFSHFLNEFQKVDRIKIPKGKRAFFVETDSLFWIHPGVRVDVVLNAVDEKRDLPILIENVLVLSVEFDPAKSGVTLALSPDEINLIQPRLSFSKIGLAIRNPEDRIRGGASKKGKQLFPKRVKVELITEE